MALLFGSPSKKIQASRRSGTRGRERESVPRSATVSKRQGARRNQRASERRRKKKERKEIQKTKKRSAFRPGFPASLVDISIPGRLEISRAHAGTRSGTKGARARLGQRRECRQQSTESRERERERERGTRALSLSGPLKSQPDSSTLPGSVSLVLSRRDRNRRMRHPGEERSRNKRRKARPTGRHREVANEKT